MSAPSPVPFTAAPTWLVRLPNWVGDAVLVLPALRALPEEVSLIGVAHPRVHPVYLASGCFRVLLAAQGWRAPLALAASMRIPPPERALVFTEAFSGAVLAYRSGAARRFGRRAGLGSVFLTDVLPAASRDRPLWESYRELAAAAGGKATGPPDFRIDPGAVAAGRAQTLLAPLSGARPVALAPGAAYGPAKQWPLERYVELCRGLRARGESVIVLGGEAETPWGRALAREGAIDLTGRTGLLDAVAVLAQSRALVTNDSGALHIARAAGTPVVALFGSSSPVWTGPSRPEEGIVVRREVPCSPCFRRRCPLRGEDHMRCLAPIEAGEVQDALSRLGKETR